MSINRKLGDLANVLDDGTEGQVLSFNASGAIAAADIAAGGGIEKDYKYNGILYPQNGTSRLYLSSDITLNEVVANIEVGPVGSDLDLRINKNDSSATTLTIADSSTSATITPNISFVSGDYITVDITSVGSSTAGTNLHMALKFS